PAVVLLVRRQLRFPADTVIERQAVVNAPVILDVPGIRRPLLADVSNGVDGAAIPIPEQEGCKRSTALQRVVSAGHASIDVAERRAAGNALTAEAVIVCLLEVAAELDRVRPLHPREIVVEGEDRVLTAVVRGTAPAGQIAEGQV